MIKDLNTNLTPNPSPRGEGNDKADSYYNRLFKGATPSVFEKAKFLRKEKTECEEILWQVLRNRQIENFKFRRQHPLSGYIPDFYCHEKKLVIEIDGGYHSKIEQKKLDKERTKAINEYGINILRFTNEDIKKKIGMVIRKISNYCNK